MSERFPFKSCVARDCRKRATRGQHGEAVCLRHAERTTPRAPGVSAELELEALRLDGTDPLPPHVSTFTVEILRGPQS